MNFDSSLWGYFIHASLAVKLVMLLLAGSSILSWTFIFEQFKSLKQARLAGSTFDKRFWSGGDLATLYADSAKRNRHPVGTEAIFQAGFKEFSRLRREDNIPADSILASTSRAMHVAELSEQERLENHMPFLATVGSAAPFVGIFGTVCGIMLTFRTLAHVQQATISMVAPGIAEALIATAMGLFAAIPAVVAYNRFTTDINRLLNRFDVFQEAFLNIIFHQTKAGAHE
ncbi:MAG: protein TolQ [Gammaproteobacteria bacterium]|nr:protein TolQ [Gammaproteobacteria bacterium]